MACCCYCCLHLFPPLFSDAWRRQGLSTWLGAAVCCRPSAVPPAIVCLVVLAAALAALCFHSALFRLAGSLMCAHRSVLVTLDMEMGH